MEPYDSGSPGGVEVGFVVFDDLIYPALVCVCVGGGKGEKFAWCRSEGDASFLEYQGVDWSTESGTFYVSSSSSFPPGCEHPNLHLAT